MLKGITIKQIKRFPDERGSFQVIMREDWKDLFAEDTVVQANVSVTYPTVVRAWHKHVRGQNDYFVALKGAIKICAYDEKTEELTEIISTGNDPQIVRMPGYYWHGFKAIGDEPAMLLYFTTKLYDSVNPDEERKLWNDDSIMPKSVNGDKNDPRVRKPWDWNSPPHR